MNDTLTPWRTRWSGWWSSRTTAYRSSRATAYRPAGAARWSHWPAAIWWTAAGAWTTVWAAAPTRAAWTTVWAAAPARAAWAAVWAAAPTRAAWAAVWAATGSSNCRGNGSCRALCTWLCIAPARHSTPAGYGTPVICWCGTRPWFAV